MASRVASPELAHQSMRMRVISLRGAGPVGDRLRNRFRHANRISTSAVSPVREIITDSIPAAGSAATTLPANARQAAAANRAARLTARPTRYVTFENFVNARTRLVGRHPGTRTMAGLAVTAGRNMGRWFAACRLPVVTAETGPDHGGVIDRPHV